MIGGTSFKAFSEVCEALESTTKRTEKIVHLSHFLKSLAPEEVVPAVSFLTGRPLPESDKRVLDLGGQTLWRVSRHGLQEVLVPKPVTILEVYRIFERIAEAAGPGSRRKKETLLDSLLNRLPASEADYLIRIISGEMRIGAVDGIVLEALAVSTSISPDSLRRSYMLLGDVAEVAKRALTGSIDRVGLTFFVPIKPMLAEMADDITQVIREHGGETAFEFKYDGARIQIHRKGEQVKIFSRRLTDVTHSLPDVVALARDRIRGREFLVEGEAVAIGEGGKPLPFQDLMRRFRRVHDVGLMVKEIPLRLFLFDVIYLDGKLLIDTRYSERWSILKGMVDGELLASRLVTGTPTEAERFMDASIRAGHEGLMAKDLSSDYSPGMRGKRWFKIKPFDRLDLAVIAVDWGTGRRRGWLSNYHLAVRDEAAGKFLPVGKTFKGLTDEEFAQVTKRLLSLAVKETDYTVYVKPQLVMEVSFNEIQRSPQYKSGFALRFARVTRIRDDKPAEDVDTLTTLKRLYRNQFKFKASPPVVTQD